MIPQCRLLSQGLPGTRIAFFLLNLDGGGAERAIVALAGEITKRGNAVDLVLGDANGDYRSEVSSAVNIVDFNSRSPAIVFGRLIAYLRRRNPAVVMSALDSANVLLLVAARLAGYKGRIVVSQRAMVAASLCELAPVRRMLMRFLQRVCFPRADALVSNSHTAASEVKKILDIPAEKIITIHNSVDAERVNRLADEPLCDNWFLKSRTPLVLSVGSLTYLKDRVTLVKAFAIVRAQRNVRLAILGKSYQPAEQRKIERLISDFGLTEYVCLAGFDSNPYRWMRRAAVLVSSSITEGCPNQILEALALGLPIVATDCPGDTAVLLGWGRWGRLVPVGDPESMAAAILASLDDLAPPDGRVRAADFSTGRTVHAYLNVLLPGLEIQARGLEQRS